MSPAVAPTQNDIGLCHFETVDASTLCLPDAGRIPLRDSDGSAPLSYSQRRLWFLQRLFFESAAWNEQVVVRFTGRFESAVLRNSLVALCERHEILRTTFPGSDSEPVQVVAPEPTVDLEEIDFRSIPIRERPQACERWIEEENGRPFKLAEPPLLRPKLLRTGDNEWVLVVTTHQILCDEYSKRILVRELVDLYQTFSTGSATRTPRPAIQYGDCAAWQRSSIDSGSVAAQLRYWTDHLGGSTKPLELPLDHPRPAMESFAGARFDTRLPAELSEGLTKLGAAEDSTLFMVLLAAFQVLLSRYVGESNVSVGTTIAERQRQETRELIGPFVNFLVLRSDIRAEKTFRQFLSEVRQTCLQAYVNQAVPFDLLVQTLQPERALAQQPLAQIELHVDEPPVWEVTQLPGLVIEPLSGAWRTKPRYDQEWHFWQGEEGLEGALLYKTALFEHGTVERMMRHFEHVVGQVVSDPDQPLSKISVLDEAERNRIVLEWNETSTEFPDAPIDQLFERQVDAMPEAVAVAFKGETLSYERLNRRANRLAKVLAGRGIGPETLVAILDNRGIDFLVTMLAVFKAGGAYLPLDPSNPPLRIARVLEQSRVPVVVAGGAFGTVLEEAVASLSGEKPQVLFYDHLVAHEESEENLRLALDQGSLAYVIYTSGSTGLPKGVMVEQRGMINHLYVKIKHLGLAGTDVVGQTASQSFDISVWQFLAPLLVGATVHIVPSEVTHDPKALLNEIETGKMTVVETVPALLRAMLEQGGEEGIQRRFPLNALRWMIATGEALPPDLCRSWLNCYSEIPLLNAYGPTECSDDVTHYTVDSPPSDDVVRMPIGRAVGNTQLYIVDRDLCPVPIGVPGEIFVGGVGVGRGYLNEPGQTEAAFVPDVFRPGEGARLYKTGDLGRYLPSGDIEFLGRIDHQTKIRGFRIELEEIEAVLARHRAIRDAVVIVREDLPNDKRIVSYVTLNEFEKPDAMELRTYIHENLPEYMTPSAFVTLDALPLNANGKVDRRALPPPERLYPEEFTPPDTPMEKQLAKLWEGILQVDRVGIQDDFFALGGHSLLAARLVAELREQIGLEIPLCAVFTFPSLSRMAQRIDDIKAGAPL